MIKKIFLICTIFTLLSFIGNYFLSKGDSVIKDNVKIVGEVGHAFVFSYSNYEKFGFVNKLNYSFKVSYEPEFDDVFIFNNENESCLVWVCKNRKWGVINIDTYKMETDFIYDNPTALSDFKPSSIDYDRHIAIYEADASIDGVKETVQIEKYTCFKYYNR